MKLKILLPLLAVLTPMSLSAAGPDGASAQFTVTRPTMVPGMTLTPGSYKISVTDHLQDRFVLRIEGTGGAHTLFLGVPAAALKQSKPGTISYQSAPDGKSAIRGFVFNSTGTPIEFVYPKNDAVALAKMNEEKVLAVDPVSEGKSEDLSKLNRDDMQIVSLWMLTPEQVNGGGDPKISASKYDQQVASLAPHRPLVKSLPHTASSLPAIFLLGLTSAILAAILAIARIAKPASA